MLKDILRFNREAQHGLCKLSEDMTVTEYVRQHQYSEAFTRHFFYPISAALWSCPLEQIETFPMRFILEFYLQHGMHKMMSMPVWRVITGGSSTYVEKLIEPFKAKIRLQTPVLDIRRGLENVEVVTMKGSDSYDEIILACHSDQALQILGAKATSVEKELLTAFPYSKNDVTLHTDTKVLPQRKRAWACWNYHIHARHINRATVTYNMNLLQRLNAEQTYCVSLNKRDVIDQGKVIRQLQYDHPLFTLQRASLQKRHHELIRRHRTSFCGAYWGNGFHEAGVASALRVCNSFGITATWSKLLESRMVLLPSHSEAAA
jgi:predicted NAD/FAD-binding protein